MIKIFSATETNFSTAGEIIINPIKCIEIKKKSLNGWSIDVEVPIKYKEYIKADKLCVVKTKSKLNPQAFRINSSIIYTNKKIKFTAEHVMFDSRKYILLDVRPTNLNGLNGLNYINQRTDIDSPFSIFSDVDGLYTAYFIRKTLLEAWEVFEKRWGGCFDADNWNISFKKEIGNDNGETIIYGKNMQGFEIYEDWSNVCTKVLPVGYDGLLLPEKYLTSEIQYETPYTKVIDFQTELDTEEQTESNLLSELREKAKLYLQENAKPKVSYTVNSNINNDLEIGDKIKVLHPFVEIFTEVLEYEYDLISKKTKSLTFGNYTRNVKTKFNNIKNTIEAIKENISIQDVTIKNQTNLINSLYKNGYVFIDENEILILDELPKEKAKNVWRFGMGGLGFSSNGYEGPYETAITIDGQINAKFITTGTMAVSRIEGLADIITQVVVQDQKIAEITQSINEIKSELSETADMTISAEGNGEVSLENINESEPVRIIVRPEKEDISYLYPNSKLYPSNTTYLKNRKIRFTNTTTNKYIDYELPEDLLYYDEENYDEFLLDYEGQSCLINKKVKLNADGTKSVLEQKETKEYSYPKINLENGNYTITVLGYSEAYIFARLMTKNLYTSQFHTKAEVNALIKMLTDEITIALSKKLDGKDFTGASIILKMNEDESNIKIEANKIGLEGYTTINGNFSVDEEGNMHCNNADISGTISNGEDPETGTTKMGSRIYPNGKIKGTSLDIYSESIGNFDNVEDLINKLLAGSNGITIYSRGTSFSENMIGLICNDGIRFRNKETNQDLLKLETFANKSSSLTMKNGTVNIPEGTIFTEKISATDYGYFENYMKTEGSAYATNFVNNSEEKLKENIKKLILSKSKVLDKIKNTDICSFNYLGKTDKTIRISYR